jgi:hypothetical protein
LQSIDTQKDRITAELDAAKANPDLRNHCLHPIQTLRSQLEKLTSMAHIFEAKSEVEGLCDEALVKIEKSNEVVPQPGGVPIKKRRVLKVAQLPTNTYLETQKDIDEFLTKLRQELEKSIEADERIEIR